MISLQLQYNNKHGILYLSLRFNIIFIYISIVYISFHLNSNDSLIATSNEDEVVPRSEAFAYVKNHDEVFP